MIDALRIPPTVRFLDRANNAAPALAGITTSAESLAWEAQGGPSSASLLMTGPEYALWQLSSILRYGVEVINDRGEAIWWGYVAGVDFHKGAITFGLSLDRMHNSVAVVYSTTDGEAGRTAFLANAESVAMYGTKQMLVSGDNLTLPAAERRRAAELNRRRLPIASTPSSGGSSGDGLTVTLACRGRFETFDWLYFSRAEGLLEYLPTSETPQKIGMGFTNNEIAWESNHALVSFTSLLGNFEKGDVIYSTGSGTNSGFYTVEQGTDGEPVAYTQTTISFDAATKEIRDSTNGLRGFEPRQVIHILGSGVNSGFQRIQSVASDGSLLVVVGSLVDEAAGASISLWTGQRIILAEPVGDELPGAAITVTAFGSQVAQSLEVTSPTAWTVATAAVLVRKVGNPADNLKLALHSDTAGDPGALLDSATIAGTGIASDADWVAVDLANTQSLAVGTTYWLVVSRTGPHSTTDYYELMLDTDLGYSPQVLKMYEGSVWLPRTPDAHMPFSLTGLEDTGAQMAAILSALGGNIEVGISGVETNQYRYGDNTALVELMALLNLGTSNNRRMLAKLTREDTLQISEEPTKPDPIIYFQRADGALVDRHNQPLIDTYPPVGQWVDLKGVVPDAVQVSELLRPAPFFLERAEYNVEQRTWRTGSRDSLDVWEMGKIDEG